MTITVGNVKVLEMSGNLIIACTVCNFDEHKTDWRDLKMSPNGVICCGMCLEPITVTIKATSTTLSWEES